MLGAFWFRVVDLLHRRFDFGATYFPMSWVTIRGFGSNGFVRSASVWAVLVPVAAKLFGHIEKLSLPDVLGKHVAVHLQLPFSWKMFFVASIAFLIANVIYWIWCPSLIKETKTFRDFSDQGRSMTELARAFRDKYPSSDDLSPSDSSLWSWCENLFNIGYRKDSQSVFDTSVESRHSADVYDRVVRLVSTGGWVQRALATLFYGVGCAAMADVIYQNIQAVLNMW